MAQCAGFSLHAGVAAEDSQRDKLERLCRYISRPAVAIERSSRLPDGRIRYTLKTPYRDGTTHVLFEQRCPVPCRRTAPALPASSRQAVQSPRS